MVCSMYTVGIGFLFLCTGIQATEKRAGGLDPLDPQLTNSLDTKGGPTLYYNGSGPVPSENETSPIPTPFTPLKPSNETEDYYYNQLLAIISNNSTSNCTKCLEETDVLHQAAVSQTVLTFTDLLIKYCTAAKFPIYAVSCTSDFSGGGLGPYWAQLYAKFDNSTGDYQAFCHYNFDTCARPSVIQIDESQYLSPKPPKASTVPTPSGKTIDVLHISDWHLDPRYDIGSEANCTKYLCCRPDATNTNLNTGVNNASVPASRYGYLFCDSPPDLALSAFDSMSQFFDPASLSFSIFTGDIVSHDNDDMLSRAYVSYEEEVTYQTFKAQMGKVPIYPTLGNHDSFPEAYNTPNDINGDESGKSNIFSWNYDLLSSMWQKDGWITGDEANYASTHYGAYAHTTAQGLRIISINTDFWYPSNIFNYFNFTNPDQSGILRFLISELDQCEQRDQRAWIIGHVLSGYDGTNNLPNPTALFYSIVRRYAPYTIAGIFFGHTHEDQLQIFYDYLPTSLTNGSLRNTLAVDYSKPLTMAFIGPSITPLTGLNAGYQLYTVDAQTFEIMDIQTYFANVSESLTWHSPVWQYEYDARDTYNVNGTWPATSPLNATFWNDVTFSMLSNNSLVETYNLFETKSSVTTKNCSSEACARQKVCYIRSGSGELGFNCPQDDGPY